MSDTKIDPVIDKLKMPSDFWHVLYAINTGMIVLDPDGWDRKHWEQSWGEPITWIEFQQRAAFSTQCPIDMAGQIKMLLAERENVLDKKPLLRKTLALLEATKDLPMKNVETGKWLDLLQEVIDLIKKM
jgi:hypothetical protein